MQDGVREETRRGAGPLKNATRGAMLVIALVVASVGLWWGVRPNHRSHLYRNLLSIRSPESHAALESIADTWEPADARLLIEPVPFVQHEGMRDKILALVREKTGRPFADAREWSRWAAEDSPPLPADYSRYLVAVYGADVTLQYHLHQYFDREALRSAIELGEIRWGGVPRDGVPPLENPRLVPAGEASYLADSDIVYGIERNGAARAYPRRILLHHELVRDRVGGEPIAGVYCTMCGVMTAYRTRAGTKEHVFGTSGFLYRSNKLMYDRETQSLWSTFDGEPVVGPLVGEVGPLEALPVVTTTWGEWRSRHPATTTLAELPNNLEIGIDYRHGGNYVAYFATDDLWFDVPRRDDRLKNKDEVFVLGGGPGGPDPVAISGALLASQPIYHLRDAPADVVIVTDGLTANRAYAADGWTFRRGSTPVELIDSTGGVWAIREDGLARADGARLDRLPGHRAYWFGWFAAHPTTKLIR